MSTNPCQRLTDWIWADPRGNLAILAIGVGGLVAAILFFGGIGPVYVPAIVGTLVLFFGAQQVWALRSLAAEIDRFSKENARLEETEERLTDELDKLESNKRKLSQQCNQLQGTVTELTGVSEGLQNELEGFQKLKTNLEKFANETGADVRSILGKAEEIQNKMQRMTTENERSLLGKVHSHTIPSSDVLSQIAQDLEFMDKDVGLSKYEFEKFMERLPQHCRDRFVQLGMTFESVAGDDGIIDFMEVENMLDRLVKENSAKSKQFS